ncbi:transketolase [bacterium]|nr:transketolase [bacterium]
MTYEDHLFDLCQRDDRLVVMTAENRAAIRGLPDRLGDRFVDTGIAEMTLVGAAAGLALRGRVPVVHALATFLTLRAYEFVRTDVGIAGLPVKLVGYVPGFLSEANGPTHQAIEDIGVMRQIPGMRVFAPSCNDELLAGLGDVLADPHPWYIRFNDKPARVEHTDGFAIGRAETLRDGDEIALLVHGTLVGQAVAAAEELERAGRSVRVVNLRTLPPLDIAAVLAAARETALVVTVEDHLNTGGLLSQVCELLVREQTAAEVLPLGLDTWFRPALLADILRYEGFTAEAIADRVMTRWHARKATHA